MSTSTPIYQWRTYPPNDNQKLCVFCYKKSTIILPPPPNEKSCSRILHLLSRYLETPLLLNSQKIQSSELLVICESCSKLGSSLCELYFQLEAVKLELNWKVKEICDRMVYAGKVPARGLAFRKQFEGRKKDEKEIKGAYLKVQTLRKKIIMSCKRKLKTSQPKLHLKRIDNQLIHNVHIHPPVENEICEQKMYVEENAEDEEETQISIFPVNPHEIKTESEILPDRDPLETDTDETTNYSYEDQDDQVSVKTVNEMEAEQVVIKVDVVELDTRNVEDDDNATTPTPTPPPSSGIGSGIDIDERTSTSSSSSGTPWFSATQCEQCGASFSCEAAVEKHRVLIHHLKNYVRCPICYEMFAGYSSYRVHRTKQYSLSQPSKCYTTNWNLLVPAAAPEYPYQNGLGLTGGHHFCPFDGCYEVFQYEQRLNLHLRTHGEWHCICCGKLFLKAHHLAWHELRMAKPSSLSGTPQRQQEQQYKCSRCSRTFEKNLSMTNHFLSKHLDISLQPHDQEAVVRGVREQCSKCRQIVPKIMMEKHMQSVHPLLFNGQMKTSK